MIVVFIIVVIIIIIIIIIIIVIIIIIIIMIIMFTINCIVAPVRQFSILSAAVHPGLGAGCIH